MINIYLTLTLQKELVGFVSFFIFFLQLYLKKTLTQVFSKEFCEISKNGFSTKHHWVTAFIKEIHKLMVQLFYLYKVDNSIL